MDDKPWQKSSDTWLPVAISLVLSAIFGVVAVATIGVGSSWGGFCLVLSGLSLIGGVLWVIKQSRKKGEE